MKPITNVVPKSDPNRLGLDYRAEAKQLPWTKKDAAPIWDVHNHINGIEAAHAFFEVADIYGIEKVWTMGQLEHVDEVKAAYGDRVNFIAVPNYNEGKSDPTAFSTDWLHRIEQFREKGSRIVKLWAAPRGLDLSEHLQIDAPIRREGIKLARSLGMMFMVHISDPDTWFATHYKDEKKYGSKMDQYAPFVRLLDEHHDVPWIAAHMGGDPEHLDHLQQLLDDHPNLYLDTSATKWMVRELSKHPQEFFDFCRHNSGRILFGSDIVAKKDDANAFDLYASRWWALRTLFETDYDGPSPIVDPDLSLVDPSLPKESTATLRGASFDDATLQMVYHDAAEALLKNWA